MGQNLGVLSNLPFIRDLLVDQVVIESTAWDLVIDPRTVADKYSLTAARIVDINRIA